MGNNIPIPDISSTEVVLAEMRTIRSIEHTGKMKVITPFVGSQIA